MSALTSSPRFVRRLSWAAALVLVAGIVAFSVAYLGNSEEPAREVVPTPAQPTPVGNTPPAGNGATVPVAREARVAAGEFILSAVTREDLAKAWRITDPQSEVRRCGLRPCTYKEWLSGNIAVVPYPAGSIDKASFAVDESFRNRVVLQVALLPKDGSKVRGQIFYIGLRAVGEGTSRRWLVTEWFPRVVIPVPNAGE